MRLINYLVTLFKPKKMGYTNEQLIELFPKHERINMNTVKQMLDTLYDHCKYYQEVFKYFEDYVNSVFPGSDYEKYKYDTPEHQEYSKYLFGSIDREDLTLHQWTRLVEEKFICDQGPRRTVSEAANLAADKWCEKLFKFHLQDNGAINEDHAGGFLACALATCLKNDSMSNITKEMITKTHDVLYNYLVNGSIYKDKDNNWRRKVDLYCDYGPNTPLYECLEEAGIPKNCINSICPWKTGIQIDYTDNAVVLVGYQKREYI